MDGAPLLDDLGALACLRCLRSLHIELRVNRDPPPAQRDYFRASLDAIVDQGLLEVGRVRGGGWMTWVVRFPENLKVAEKIETNV